MVSQQTRVKPLRIDIRITLKPTLVPLLQHQIISSSLRIMLIRHQTLLSIPPIVPQLPHLAQNVTVNRNVMLAHQNTLRWTVVVQPVKLVLSDLQQSQSFSVCCQ